MEKPSFIALVREKQSSRELCPFPGCYVRGQRMGGGAQLFWFSAVFTEDLHTLPGLIRARMHAANIQSAFGPPAALYSLERD